MAGWVLISRLECIYCVHNVPASYAGRRPNAVEASSWVASLGAYIDIGRSRYYGGGTATKVNNNNKPLTSDFVSLHLKGRTDGFALRGGDATQGAFQTMYDGPRPDHRSAPNNCHWHGFNGSYQPMRKQGAIILGTGTSARGSQILNGTIIMLRA